MNDFTASNGGTVEILDSGRVRVIDRSPRRLSDNATSVSRATYLDVSQFEALREFFQAEADERLGRWRWPENPDITVRVAPKHAQRIGASGDTVMIQQDSDGYVGYYGRDSLPEITDRAGGIVRAGHAYFDAHPEPKPWHDAQIGETWVLLGAHLDLAVTVVGGMSERWFTRATVFGRVERFELTDPSITDARRIWPEVSS